MSGTNYYNTRNSMNFNNMNMNPMMNSNMNMGVNPMMNNNNMNMGVNPMMNNNNMNMGMNPMMNNNMNMGMNPMMNNNMNMGMNPMMNNNNMNMGMNPMMNNNATMAMNPNVMNQMFMATMINQLNQTFIKINNEMAKLAQKKMENALIPTKNNQNSNDGELPRTQEKVNYDPFSEYNGPRINVKCVTPAGHTVMMNAPMDATVYSLLRQYILKIQLGPNTINNGIYFVSNGKKLTNEDMNKKVGNAFTDNTNIIVIDQKGLIGGL